MRRFIPWLGAFALIVLVFGTLYGTVQQAQRSSANSPQIQLAEDTAAALNSGTAPAELIAGHVNMAKSLAPFVIIYDKSGKVVSGSGYLNGSVPRAPYGVLTAANGVDFHTVTWQPQANVRIAAVTTSADKYYVLSGRSLREVESNESKTFMIAAIGALLSTVVLVSVYSLSPRK